MRRALVALLLTVAASVGSMAQASAPASLADYVRDEPANANAWREYGAERHAAGRYLESIAAYERALQLSGGRMPGLAERIAEAYSQAGNEKQAHRWRQLAELGTSRSRAILPGGLREPSLSFTR